MNSKFFDYQALVYLAGVFKVLKEIASDKDLQVGNLIFQELESRRFPRSADEIFHSSETGKAFALLRKQLMDSVNDQGSPETTIAEIKKEITDLNRTI